MKFLDEIPGVDSSNFTFFFRMNGEFYVRFHKYEELYKTHTLKFCNSKNGHYIKYKGKRYYSRYPLMCHYIA